MNARQPFYTLKKLFFPGLFFSIVFHCTTCTTNTLADSWPKSVSVESDVVVNKSTSIAVDKNGKPYICYSDIRNHRLRYATINIYGTSTTPWLKKTILSNSNAVGASIAVDTKKKIHICYIDDDDNLYYTTNAYDYGDWFTAALDTSGYPGVNTDMAVDPNDKVHICYYDNFNKILKYATNLSDTWETTDIETLDSLVDAADCSIAIGTDTSVSVGTDTVTTSSASVHISYIGFVGFGTGTVSAYAKDNPHTGTRLKHATNASGAWTTTVVHPNGDARYGASIAVDKNRDPHISYSTVDKIMYGIYKDGLWFIEPVDKGSFDWKTSLGIDTLGNAHICYYDNKNENLMYATNNSGSWKSTIVDSVDDGGKYNSLAVALGKVHISYYDASNRAVMYTAKCIATSLKAKPKNLSLNLTDMKTGTVTVTLAGKGKGACPIQDETITATINKSGIKYISVSPKSASTDENGQAIFTIGATGGTGTANVTFKYNKLQTKTKVTVE